MSAHLARCRRKRDALHADAAVQACPLTLADRCIRSKVQLTAAGLCTAHCACHRRVMAQQTRDPAPHGRQRPAAG